MPLNVNMHNYNSEHRWVMMVSFAFPFYTRMFVANAANVKDGVRGYKIPFSDFNKRFGARLGYFCLIFKSNESSSKCKHESVPSIKAAVCIFVIFLKFRTKSLFSSTDFATMFNLDRVEGYLD